MELQNVYLQVYLKKIICKLAVIYKQISCIVKINC